MRQQCQRPTTLPASGSSAPPGLSLFGAPAIHPSAPATGFSFATAGTFVNPLHDVVLASKSASHAPAISSPQAENLFQEGQRLYEQQRYSDAAKSWGQAALLKHAASHAFLSSILFEGRPDVPKDEKRAFELASTGAAMSCAHSKGALGRCLINGFGVAQDEAIGLEFARESAAAGSSFGQFVLGRYYDGSGVAQDLAEAVRLYRLAAAQGYAAAQSNLGSMFAEGRGVAKDRAEAVRWFGLAAAQGNVGAQLNLGVMFDEGRGVARDSAEAVRWFGLAAAQGDAQAITRLKLGAPMLKRGAQRRPK